MKHLLVVAALTLATAAIGFAPRPRVGAPLPSWTYPGLSPGVVVRASDAAGVAPCPLVPSDTCLYQVGGSSSVDQSPVYSRTAEAFDTATNRWLKVPPYLGHGRDGLRAAGAPCTGATNRRCLYIAGGLEDDKLTSIPDIDVQMFDPVKNAWSEEMFMSTQRYSFGMASGPCAGAVAHTCIYAMGGGIGDSSATASAEMYNPASGQWVSVVSMPYSVVGNAVTAPCWGALTHSCVYVVAIGLGTQTSEMFDPATKTWKDLPKPSDNSERYGLASGRCPSGSGQCLYIPGGRDSDGGPENTVQVFTIKSGTWDSAPAMNLQHADGPARSAPCLGSTSKCIYELAPASTGGPGPEMYKPGRSSWTGPASLAANLVSAGSATGPCPKAAAQRCIYLAGGESTLQPLGETYMQIYNPLTGFTSFDQLAQHRVGPGVADAPCKAGESRTCIYVIGGRQGATDLTSVERYDPSTTSWSAAKPLPVGRSDFATATATCPAGGSAGICIYVMGGSEGNARVHTVEVYHTASNSWTEGKAFPDKGLSGDAGTTARCPKPPTRRCVYLVGGGPGVATPLPLALAYDPAANRWTPLAPLPRPLLDEGATAAPCIGAMRRLCVYVAGGLTASSNAATVGPAGNVRRHGSEESTKATEMFDPATARWSSVGNLIEPRESLGFVSAPCHGSAGSTCLWALGGFSSRTLASVEELQTTG